MNTSSAAATAYNRDAFVKATADDARSSPRSASVAQDHAYEDGPATAVVERGELFRRKLHACSLVFDFSTDSHAKEKEAKSQLKKEVKPTKKQ